MSIKFLSTSASVSVLLSATGFSDELVRPFVAVDDFYSRAVDGEKNRLSRNRRFASKAKDAFVLPGSVRMCTCVCVRERERECVCECE